MYRSLQSGHFIDVKNNEKWQFSYWNFTLSYAIYRCINDKYTPKNGDFYRKNDESIIYDGDFITKKLRKHTKV